MDFREIFARIKTGLKNFWQWLKPYLVRFHHWRKRIWKKYQINKVILLLMLVVVLVSSVYLYVLAKSVKVSTLESSMKEVTIFYDKDGDEAGALSGKGTYTSLTEMSPYIVDAVIATEDRSFYEHNGYNLKGIARALLSTVKAGSIQGGGSTITQQLAKNAFLTQDQKLSRKAKELFMAIEIEKHYSKDQILEMYLNNSYFGNGVWGVQDAARKYYGVNANEVSLGQAASLIGMLKGPNLYNPIDDPQAANNRRDTVLSVMVETQKISEEQAAQEQTVDLSSLLYDTYEAKASEYRYPYYFDAVLAEAVDKYNLDASDLNKGYRIYTALDQNQQTAMQNTYLQDHLFPGNAPDGQMVQSGSVAMNPKTGGVTALVGGRGDYVFQGFNYATNTQRSPGSVMKPISVYTAALEKGYTPASILEDQPQDYYQVNNYDGTYSGQVPMYQAVAQSLNAPAVWLLHQMGEETGFKKTGQFGVKLAQSDNYPGLALGGLERGVSPWTMASAYTVFANQGKQPESHLITKIVDATGAVLVDNTKVETIAVTTSEVANSMTSMLLGVFSNGTGISAQPYGYTVAGKTGTQEASFDSSKTSDQWIVGYTPNIVIATWLGFEITDENHYLEGSSSTGVGPLFKAEAEAILPYVENEAFTVADAYATGGEVLAPAEVVTDNAGSSENSGSSGWQDTLNDIGETAKEVGGQIKDGFDAVTDGIGNWWDSINGQ
ncbi:penicillin-binding protein 2A [Enterococcus sp. PF1-24]|uniref:PBP1A family penicillin-binding protein n=1 Tax=unclassified Enterococcus TaxID=2608891 RepID=UPI002476E77F|nr:MULTISPECIES: PBP1A family penicillin-binding protein [unclassified Enterococcus]MDH6363513.1 penicillin-binding protein 2A [Enterococcus sp. PFB1-1]MDH6400607.1 penicillin-binding protein 2A [Enterococcus sp. PF1-24]